MLPSTSNPQIALNKLSTNNCTNCEKEDFYNYACVKSIRMTNKNIEKYLNIFDLYYDIEYKTFRNVILYNIIKKFKAFYKEFCDGLPNVKHDSLKMRASMAFAIDSFVFQSEKKDIDSLRSRLDKARRTIEKEYNVARADLAHYGLTEEYVEAINYWNVLEYIAGQEINFLFLLKRKNSHLLFPQDHGFFFKSSEEIESDYSDMFLPTKYKIYRVDNNPENPLNDPKQFERITELLVDAKLLSMYLDYDKCIKELEDIEKEIANANQDSLIDGL
jgi:hypothetical protein